MAYITKTTDNNGKEFRFIKAPKETSNDYRLDMGGMTFLFDNIDKDDNEYRFYIKDELSVSLYGEDLPQKIIGAFDFVVQTEG